MQQVQSGLTPGTDWRRIGVGLIRPSPHAGQAGGGLAQKVVAIVTARALSGVDLSQLVRT